MNKLVIISLAIILLTFNACDIINPDEEIPAYIHVDSIEVVADYATEGSSSHKLSDVWITVDNKVIGGFEMPATVPVLASGNSPVLLSAGVRENGINNTRVIYKFYATFNEIVALKPGEITTINPTIGYFSSTQFPFLEDFESAGNDFTQTPSSTADLTIISDPLLVFEGSRSGLIEIDDTENLLEMRSTSFVIDIGKTDVFVEMNYRCNQIFQVMLLSNDVSAGQATLDPIITLLPKEDWNKIYIDLTEPIGRLGGDFFNLTIKAEKQDTVPMGKIYLDNFKVVHQ